MLERRPMFGALIGLTLCISLWSLTMQESPIITELPYTAQNTVATVAQNITTQLPPSVMTEQLGPNDFTNLIDLNDFEFNINHKSCNDLQIHPLVLILIHSAPLNWKKRKLIRETWGREDSRSRLFFLLGAVNSTSLQQKIEYENYSNGDIIQGSFYDAYKNMTYKHIMALKWFTYFCPEAKFILKTDDDVFINSPNVYDYLDNDVKRKNLILCHEVVASRVKRTFRSKWRVSLREYPARYYPSYCPGFSIIYSRDTAFQLYREAQKTKYFWIDDVHVTGTLAQQINTTITPLGDLFLTYSMKRDVVNGSLNGSTIPFLFTVPDLMESEIRILWRAVQSSERMSTLSST